ncbi:ATP-binding cassette domain-containing protein [Longibaculum muris]|uniref:ATP-binding cassette domain-containing protein n=1 Tax=Longibaculum muris TaxID=1796628 RepID=UPI00189E8C62|nr:ATP-binding cassette domain-containing protein [Longibaculum muris]
MELTLEHVSKKYKENDVVKDVNVSLKPGVHALLGANGSGKTTLMRLICGLLKGEGSIHFDDIDASLEYENFASHIGYIPQNFGYYPHYTLKEFLDYMAIVKNLNKDYSEKRILSLVKELGLENQLNKKMKTLSGGMLRRVGIIQALLSEPEILILDEPTAGLDPKERIVFRNLIASLSQSTIILLSTHIVSDIESIADDILIMKEGEIIMHGIYEDLIKVIKGKVWEVLVPKQEASSFMKRYRVVKSHNQNNGVYMRIVSDLKPHDEAIAVIPDLDDLYLYYFAEEVAYD